MGTDLYGYRKGIARLLQCLGRHDPSYNKVLRCRGELSDQHKTEIVNKLDRLARSRIGVSFEALCAAPEPSADVGALIEEGRFDQVARLWKKACR